MNHYLEKMWEKAKIAYGHAYCPYSKFAVGCCILTDDDKLFVGCNVENSCYAIGQCAEYVAIGAMAANGRRHIKAVLIYTDSETPCFPCGGCRQALSEFSDSDTMIYIANSQRIIDNYTITELLPKLFSKDTLGVNQ